MSTTTAIKGDARVTRASRLTWDDLPIEWRAEFCDAFAREEGREPAGHADPAGFTLAELRELTRFAVCPLHLDRDHRDVPFSMMNRDLYRATSVFDKLTAQNLGRRPEPEEDGHLPYVVTREQYEDVLAKHRHARPWLDARGEELHLTIIEEA